ncbi:hypothetical protein [Pelagicoccus sp. SDUM812002]|uniref:hypothetical protein n=1 Tax=Pelagicoccus sp. SDUM812002 TaxID=3041266 RepID=UPI00280EB43F|nr:hypothetical protein [Pelagicoccus sp. SDUM812002]MDQ8188522.1 hypothetical protein [Pelagicoccus sp. SDUM812002]
MRVFLKFLADGDDSYDEAKNDGIDFTVLPRIGEVVDIKGFYHAVATIVHSVEEGSITIHLGQSAQSPAEAQHWIAQSEYPKEWMDLSDNETI